MLSSYRSLSFAGKYQIVVKKEKESKNNKQTMKQRGLRE